jgi:hypothetical protein
MRPTSNNIWQKVGISRIPKSSAAQLVNKTVPIPGDPGYYVVSLNVFHQLHCLVSLQFLTIFSLATSKNIWNLQNMVRKRLYSTQAYAADDELMGIEHIEHCIDALRQSLMCSADITPLPWTWVEEDNESKEVATVAHTCRDFEKIRGWAMENKIKHFDRKVYVEDELRD